MILVNLLYYHIFFFVVINAQIALISHCNIKINLHIYFMIKFEFKLQCHFIY